MTLLKRRAFALVLLLLLISLTTAAAQGPPAAPAPADAAPLTVKPSTAADAALDESISTRYRLGPSDVIELIFPYVPELDQTLTVQPDGYVTARPVGELRVQGRTIPELRQMLYAAFEKVLREPVMTVVLKEFEKPYFVAAGEVKAPGKFDLRGTVSVTQALALAGGLTESAKLSQVILFRRFTAELVEVKQVNVKKMMDTRDLSEDHFLQPGDIVYVPRTLISRIRPYLPTAGLGFYLNPLQ